MPSASFFDMIDDAISGSDSTVAVTSRSAYSRLSAGAIRAVWPIRQHAELVDELREVVDAAGRREKPGIDSSLSSVPPVWPSPRPDTIGTATPHAATAGASGIEILSPTPPVECLSIFARGDARQIEDVARARHRVGPGRELAIVEPAKEDRHHIAATW